MMRIRSSSTMAVMVSEIDIYRSAKLLIDQHTRHALRAPVARAPRTAGACEARSDHPAKAVRNHHGEGKESRPAGQVGVG